MANYVILKIVMFFIISRVRVKMNLSVGGTVHVKDSWALPCLLKFGQLTRMFVQITRMHFRKEAKLA